MVFLLGLRDLTTGSDNVDWITREDLITLHRHKVLKDLYVMICILLIYCNLVNIKRLTRERLITECRRCWYIPLKSFKQ